jgi:hypothetical protein
MLAAANGFAQTVRWTRQFKEDRAMRQFASVMIAALLVAGCLGCGNTEADKVAAEKKKVRVNWSEKERQADDWWASEATKTRESRSEYVAEREEDSADADQDRPLSERRRRRRVAKFAADDEPTERDTREERNSYEESKPRRRLTDEIDE